MYWDVNFQKFHTAWSIGTLVDNVCHNLSGEQKIGECYLTIFASVYYILLKMELDPEFQQWYGFIL